MVEECNQNIDESVNAIRPLLCIVEPKINGYIKYFHAGSKNMSYKIEDEGVYLKYNVIWNKIKKTLNARFHSQSIYDGKYIKTKVKLFDGVKNALFSDNEIPKERNHYICIAAICIDTVLKIDKKSYPQAYLEQCKYKIKRRKMVDFIDAEVDLNSDDSDDSE